ncbi:hypothetical protein Val02_41730 [Virgisporangium aliadipatigenens]|uniref:Low molecular weight protein antigen 6 PH domain-containing protein n=1 Tax=Virgisporangium aliadipatigenens TaxID=741659 RepID=A0A8J3YN08_9ACTN|nr:PH domain-containing protein [Virgisporangium aliadipatigenens]GIJ47287.1 hypothetical protein Val02_41730 [Virgisporangium aliadipatigenens]
MLADVDLRPPAMPPDHPGPDFLPPSTMPDEPVDLDAPVEWRVNPGVAWTKAAGAAAFAMLAVALGRTDRGALFMLALGAVVLGLIAARDLLVPVRVAADPTGVTVATGFAGRRHIEWSEVEAVRVDERARLGIRNQLLELDTGEQIYLYGERELGAPCAEVAARLEQFRTRSAG